MVICGSSSQHTQLTPMWGQSCAMCVCYLCCADELTCCVFGGFVHSQSKGCVFLLCACDKYYAGERPLHSPGFVLCLPLFLAALTYIIPENRLCRQSTTADQKSRNEATELERARWRESAYLPSECWHVHSTVAYTAQETRARPHNDEFYESVQSRNSLQCSHCLTGQWLDEQIHLTSLIVWR